MSTTIDAAIIKALVDHVGGDSSSIPDGVIGSGKTYTEGDGINIVNDQISVEYDANTMELKDGKLAAKNQITVGDGLTTSNGKIVANLDTNTMQMSSGKISAKTQLSAGNGISIASGKVNVNYDTDTMELKDGKLGVSTKLALTSAGYRAALNYTSTMGSISIPMNTPGQIPLGSFIVTNDNGTKRTHIVVHKYTDSNNYDTINTTNGNSVMMIWMESEKKYSVTGVNHVGEFTDEYGLFYRGVGQAYMNATEVVTGVEYQVMINYILSKLSA